MTLRRGLWAIGLVALIAGGILFAIIAESPYTDDRGQLNELAPVIAWSFVGTGLWAWARRPENRTGALMVAIGFGWMLATLIVAQTPALYITGWVLYLLPYALLIHLLLAFPSGRLERRLDRVLVTGAYVPCLLLQAAQVVVFQPVDPCCGLARRENPLLITRDDGLFDALVLGQSVFSILALVALTVVLTSRFRAASETQRRALTPVLGAGVVMTVSLILTLTADLILASDDVEAIVDLIGRLAILCVPFGFLAGLARSRLSRAVAVSELVERLGARSEQRRPLRDALADALGDPSLSLAFDVGDRHVDAEGRTVALVAGAHTPVEREGRRVGAIVHDPALAEEEPAALRAAAGAVALSLENERLEAELRARIGELQRSRARMVEAEDAGRRRLERDLHDGAQQRLVALALTLRLARGKAEGALAELLDEAAAELQQATNELRELARGIHPAVLTDLGLGPAIGVLASRAAVPVEVAEVPADRLPAPVESAAYFLVAEALTNVSRYASASWAEVRIARANGSVTVQVSDDGVGGADPAIGSGLRGLADRAAALDGSFGVWSPPGGGTTVRAVLPCGS